MRKVACCGALDDFNASDRFGRMIGVARVMRYNIRQRLGSSSDLRRLRATLLPNHTSNGGGSYWTRLQVRGQDVIQQRGAHHRAVGVAPD